MTHRDAFLARVAFAWPLDRWTSRKVIVAISGGPDSVALLRALVAVHRSAEGTGKIVAAHFNHRLRGAESDEDESFVRELCDKLGIELFVGHAARSIEDNKERRGLEGSAREARYDFLRQLALSEGARYVAVAHTADDQAETILHHILRGTGLAGLRGMPRVRKLTEGVSLIRPLISFSRQDLRDYLAAIGQAYRTDSSNADTDRTRNRIRRQLLPHLAKRYNAEVAGALSRLGRLAGEAQEVIEQLAADVARKGIFSREGKEQMVLEAAAFAAAAPIVVREALIWIWRELEWPRDAMGLEEWEALAEMVTQQQPVITSKNLPGRVSARRIGERLVLSRDR